MRPADPMLINVPIAYIISESGVDANKHDEYINSDRWCVLQCYCERIVYVATAVQTPGAPFTNMV